MKAPKNSIDRYLEMRFKEWAFFCQKWTDQGLGYPKKSIEGRLRDDGGVLSKSTALPVYPTNDEVEEISRLLTELYYEKVMWSLAIKICYLHKGDKAMIRKSQMSVPTYHINLRLAKAWFAGRISR